MAIAKFMMDSDFELQLERALTESTEIAKKAIYAGSDMAADAMKANLKGVIKDKSATELVDALGVTPIKKWGTEWSAHVGFDGYDSNHTAYQLLARVMESGTSTRDKKPFVRKTMTQNKAKIQAEMERVVMEELNKL